MPRPTLAVGFCMSLLVATHAIPAAPLVPPLFVENAGQAASEVAYHARAGGMSSVVRTDGSIAHQPLAGAARWQIAEHFVDARSTRPIGSETAATRLNYLVGSDPRGWRRDVKTWSSLDLGQPWAGIDAMLRIRDGRIERVFVVAPGADPGDIRVGITGAHRLQPTAKGELVADAEGGGATFSAPIAWQVVNGRDEPVEIAYRVTGTTYGFELGAYRPELPLMIDPFIGATYLGGTGSDVITAVALHPSSGNTLIAGYTNSPDFPLAAGPTISGTDDAFVAMYTPDLQTLMAVTVIGGAGTEYVSAIGVHPGSGEVYIAGATNSADMAGTPGGHQAARSSGYDFFVSRLTDDLGTLLQSTYYGGNGQDGIGPGIGASGFTVLAHLGFDDASGDAYLAGNTHSTNLDVGTGGAQATAGSGGSARGVVARFTASLAAGSLVRATYFRNASGVGAGGIDVHELAIANGSVYFSGTTTDPDLPSRAGAAQADLAGASDYYLARLSPDLTTVQRTTFHGGTSFENMNRTGLAVHPQSGDVYLAGTSSSPALAVPNGYLTTQPSSGAVAIARFSGDLGTLLSGTWLATTTSFHTRLDMRVNTASGDLLIVGRGAAANTNGPDYAGAASLATPGHWAARLSGDLSALAQATVLPIFDARGGMALEPGTNRLFLAGTRSTTGTGPAIPCLPPGAQSTPIGNTGLPTGLIYVLTPDLQGDRTPGAFPIEDQAGVPQSTVIVSAPVTLTGFDSATAISVSGGTAPGYSINGADFTSSAGTACPGDQVRVRHTSSPALSTTANTVLTIGGVADTFSTTTVSAAPDGTPDAFSFSAADGVAPNAVVNSNAVTIGGINIPVPISVTGGEYQIGSGAFTSAAGTVTNGSVVRVRHTASASFGATTTTTLTAGGLSANFVSTTLDADTTPEVFSFTDQTGVAAGAVVSSNAIVINGVNAPAPIAITGGQYSINDGAFTEAAANVSNGDRVVVRVTSSATAGAATSATLTVGGVSDTFTVTTAAAAAQPPSQRGGGGALDAFALSALLLLSLLARRRRVPGSCAA